MNIEALTHHGTIRKEDAKGQRTYPLIVHVAGKKNGCPEQCPEYSRGISEVKLNCSPIPETMH
jgi:hypothetical protein